MIVVLLAWEESPAGKPAGIFEDDAAAVENEPLASPVKWKPAEIVTKHVRFQVSDSEGEDSVDSGKYESEEDS